MVGASFWDIVHLLSGEFGLKVCVAGIIGLPISYYYMNRWLDNFAYHITMTPVPFLLSICMSLIILMLTVGYPALLAYTKNPTEMLVSE